VSRVASHRGATDFAALRFSPAAALSCLSASREPFWGSTLPAGRGSRVFVAIRRTSQALEVAEQRSRMACTDHLRLVALLPGSLRSCLCPLAVVAQIPASCG
jgi:hypothetical protein